MSSERESFTDLADLFGALAAKLGEVTIDARGELIDYRRGGTKFAVLDGSGVELRLHPEVAEAARRTPSTTASPRGDAWIRFAPPELDGHSLDRAEAWFLSACRAAAGHQG